MVGARENEVSIGFGEGSFQAEMIVVVEILVMTNGCARIKGENHNFLHKKER